MSTQFVPAKVPDFPRAPGFRECDENCLSCDRTYDPAIVKTIDMDLPLYGGVAPLSVHICCCTGKTDWLHTIEDEPGSLASKISEQLKKYADELRTEDRVVLSNISLDPLHKTTDYSGSEIMILSADFCMLTNVQLNQEAAGQVVRKYAMKEDLETPQGFEARPMGYKAVVLICSHMRRDARCGKTAPVLLEQFEEELRERDLFFDPDEGNTEDDRVLLTCVSHIGGHKFAGNVLVYRRRDDGTFESIWLGRVFPHHVGYIVDRTILEGLVPYPLLRGGTRW